MKSNPQKASLANLLQGAALAGAVAVSTPSMALEYNYDEWSFNVDTTLGYSAQWRTENAMTSWKTLPTPTTATTTSTRIA